MDIKEKLDSVYLPKWPACLVSGKTVSKAVAKEFIWQTDYYYSNNNLEYLASDQIASCYIYGNSGIVHPDGTIGMHKNVGKWPSAYELYEELKLIAELFPELQINVSIGDDEYCVDDTRYHLTFFVADGNVTFEQHQGYSLDEIIDKYHEGFDIEAELKRQDKGLRKVFSVASNDGVCAIPDSWKTEFDKRAAERPQEEA